MGRYRKIDTRIWNDAKFRALSDRGKLAFLFVLTHQNLTSLGAMRATVAGLAKELSWPTKQFRIAFEESLRKALIEHDEASCFIAFPNFLRYNGPESPNVVKSWGNSLDLIPECALKAKLIARTRILTEAMGDNFSKALPEAFRKSMPNPEPEQEPEQEPEKKRVASKTEGVEFPPGMEAPEVRAALDRWLAYKAAKKQSYASPASISALLGQFHARDGLMAPGRFCEDVDSAMANNYTGCFFKDKGPKNGTTNRDGAGQSYHGPAVDAPSRHPR